MTRLAPVLIAGADEISHGLGYFGPTGAAAGH
jgi:hypothetical protein